MQHIAQIPLCMASARQETLSQARFNDEKSTFNHFSETHLQSSFGRECFYHKGTIYL
jgi:hypothetical protein